MLGRILLLWRPYSVRPRKATSSRIAFPAASLSAKASKFPSNVSMRVSLTAQEENICKLLNSVTEEINRKRTANGDPGTTELRIAGGWVRDKLLGMESNDIDVAVNNMMGFEFAEIVNEYLSRTSQVELTHVAKISCNPEKSKHLETATVKIMGLECDFVNLRNESYAEDSRIPSEVTFGTPTEDAHRRDITINALFYNIRTREIEDFTQKGLIDLEQRLVRTPLPSYETFRDDPLRILRCLRFASRFGFRLADDIRNAIDDEDIKLALSAKISKERVSTEIDKMLRGPDPVQAVDYVCNLGLYPVIFAHPTDYEGKMMEPMVYALQSAKIVRWLTTAVIPDSKYRLGRSVAITDENRRMLYFAALFSPFRKLRNKEKPSSTSMVPSVRFVLKDSLKSTTIDRDVIGKMHEMASSLWDYAQRNTMQLLARREIGMVIRDLGSLPYIMDQWPLIFIYSLVDQLLPYAAEIDRMGPIRDQRGDSSILPPVQQMIHAYAMLFERIEQLGVANCWQWKHILDGQAVSRELDVPPNPEMKNILRSVMEWQLENPDGSAIECAQWLKGKYSDLAIQIRQDLEKNKKKKKNKTQGL